MEPIARRTGASGIEAAREPSYRSSKTGPSDFDARRADGEKPASSTSPQPHVATVDDPQRLLLASDYRRKLDSASSQQKVFEADAKQLGSRISDLDRQVTGIRKSSAAAPLRERLERIGSDFDAMATLLKNPATLADPARLLEMQKEISKLAYDIEVMSRTISEVASGVRTVLSTQL